MFLCTSGEEQLGITPNQVVPLQWNVDFSPPVLHVAVVTLPARLSDTPANDIMSLHPTTVMAIEFSQN